MTTVSPNHKTLAEDIKRLRPLTREEFVRMWPNQYWAENTYNHITKSGLVIAELANMGDAANRKAAVVGDSALLSSPTSNQPSAAGVPYHE